VLVETQAPGKPANGLRHRSLQHVAQGDHEQVWPMDAADGRTGPTRICLAAILAPIPLHLGAGSAPFLLSLPAAMRALVFCVCSCFDFRDCFRLPTKVPDPGLGIDNLGRAQVIETRQKTAKIVV
jgi:hypothetical protein